MQILSWWQPYSLTTKPLTMVDAVWWDGSVQKMYD